MAECQHYCSLKDGMKILPVPTLQDVDALLYDMKMDLKAFLHRLNSGNNRAVNLYMANWKKDIHEVLDKPSSDIVGVHDLLVNLQKFLQYFSGVHHIDLVCQQVQKRKFDLKGPLGPIDDKLHEMIHRLVKYRAYRPVRKILDAIEAMLDS
jgi:hypothetical protein